MLNDLMASGKWNSAGDVSNILDDKAVIKEQILEEFSNQKELKRQLQKLENEVRNNRILNPNVKSLCDMIWFMEGKVCKYEVKNREMQSGYHNKFINKYGMKIGFGPKGF